MVKKKREKQTPGDDSTSKQDILPYFWDLVSLDEDVRCSATCKLVRKLKDLELTGDKEQSSDEKEEILPFCKYPEIDYAVKRLIKGLASGRKFARVGFSTALTQVLQSLSSINVDAVREGVEDQLKTTKSLKGQEEKDVYFGRLFGLVVLARTLLLKENPPMEDVSLLLKEIFQLYSKKIYLREITCVVICDIFEQLSWKSFQEHVLPVIDSALSRSWEQMTPDYLLIILKATELFKELTPLMTEKGCLTRTVLLEKQNLVKLGELLAESSNYCHPKMHSVWTMVLPAVLSKRDSFPLFWSSVVDGVLMQSSHERKFLAMSVVQFVLRHMTPDQVPVVFSQALVKCIINACSSKDTYLFQAATKLLQAIPEEIGKNHHTSVAITLVRHLIKRSTLKLKFDEGTKSKTVERLVNLFSLSDVEMWIEELKGIFVSGHLCDANGDRIEDIEEPVCRQWAINQLATLVKSSSVPKAESWLLDVAKFLFSHAYFDIIKAKSKKPKLRVLSGNNAQDHHKFVQQRFESVLKELSHYHPEQGKETKEGNDSSAHAKHTNQHLVAGTLANGELIVYELVVFAKELLSLPKYVTLTTAWLPEANEMFTMALDKIEKIRKKSTASNSEQRAFQLLLLHCILRMFSNSRESVDVLQELIECYNKTTQAASKKSKSSISKEEPHWSEVVSEILLSLLTQPSSLMRQVVDTVMSSIVVHMTTDAVNIIVNALLPEKSDAEGQLQMEDSSDEEEADENDDKIETDSHVDDDDNSDDEDEEDSEDSADDDDDGDGEVDEQLRQDVKAALGNAAVDDDDEEEEEEDIDMDDVDESVLVAMDRALGAVFQTRTKERSNKKQTKEMKRSIVHFKLRVLDIVELIVKRRSAEFFVLGLVDPLLDVLKAGSSLPEEKALHERAQGLLKNQLCKIKSPKLNKSEMSQAADMVVRLIADAKDAPSAHVVNLMSSVIMFLVRVLKSSESATDTETRLEPTVERNLVAAYKTALLHFMTVKQSHLQPVLFCELIKRHPDIAWEAAGDMPRFCNEAINTYRKMQAVEMSLLLLQHKPKDYNQRMRTHYPIWLDSFKQFLTCHSTESSLKSKQLSTVARLIKKSVDDAASLDLLELTRSLLQEVLVSFLDGKTALRCPAVSNQLKQIASKLDSCVERTPSADIAERQVKHKRKRSTPVDAQVNGKRANGKQRKGKKQST